MPWDVPRWLSARPAPSVGTRRTPATAPACWSGTTTARSAPTNGEITADIRVSALAEARYAGLTDLSPVTMQAYRDRLDRQILPGLGQLRVRELTVGVLDRHLRLVAEKHGVATARTSRSVLSG